MRSTRPVIAKLLLVDLGRRPVWLAVLLLVIALAAGSTAFSVLMVDGLSAAFEAGIGRAGADIAIVPKGATTTFRETLVSGRPTPMYLTDSVEEVRRMGGVEAASSQVFVASAQASCCTAGDVLIVAYDPESDFVVNPWIDRGTLAQDGGSATLGANLRQPVGLHIEFFGTRLLVRGALDPTGWGFFDNAAFVTHEAVRHMETASTRRQGVARLEIPSGAASVIWVRASGSPSALADDLRAALPDADVVELASLLPGVRSASRRLGRGLAGVAAAVAFMTALMIAAVFGLVVERRKAEIALLRTCGASCVGLMLGVMFQASVVGAVGGLTGGLAGASAASVFSMWVTVTSQIPVLAPDPLKIAGIGALSGVISAVVAGAAAAGPALRASLKAVPDAIR